MVDVVREVVERLWPGWTASIERLSGGITNANYKVDVDGEQVVIRVPGKKTDLLGIDRTAEVAANRIAATIGVAPEVLSVDVEPRGAS